MLLHRFTSQDLEDNICAKYNGKKKNQTKTEQEEDFSY